MADRLTRADFLASYDEGRALLAAAASLAGADARVPSCPRWSVADLVVHAGNVHAWAQATLESGVEQPQVFDVPPDGVEESDLVGWYVERSQALSETLAGLGAEAGAQGEVWTFGPVPGADFWFRRQAHEVAMHGLDAQLASGLGAVDVVGTLRADLAADGVDELLTVFLPRMASWVPRPSMPARLALVASETGDRWELEPDGQIDSAATGSAVGAELAAPAGALWGLLWRRVSLAEDGAALGVQVEGDPAVVEALFAAKLTP